MHSLSLNGSDSLGESSKDTHFDPILQERMNPNLGPHFFHSDSIPNSSNSRPPFLKMDFPRFDDGDEPLAWIFKAEHYFDFFSIEDFKKVKMASFHFDGEPLQWF